MSGSTTGHRVDIDLDRLGAKVTMTKENVGMTLLRANQLKANQTTPKPSAK